MFASQQRLVTAEDYKAIISQRYTKLLNDVAAWGGEDNVPPVYGKVYVSLDFKDGITTDVQDKIKNTIQNELSNNLSVMSIDTEFVDPSKTYLELNINFDFDPELTNINIGVIQDRIKSEISDYFATNLNKFDSIFRQSILLSFIDNISPSILNSSMKVKMQQRFNPTLRKNKNYNINFPTVISNPDDENLIIQSTTFVFDGKNCILRNSLSQTKLELYDVSNGVILRDNIGSYKPSKGIISLIGFGDLLTSYPDEGIKLFVTPGNQNTIKPLRNYILDIDISRTFVSGVIDNQNTETSLTT